MITTKTAKALRIIKDAPRPLTARIFAERMWKDSEGWKKYHNIGRGGATRGSGMWLSAGSYLAKLRKRKLITIELTPSYQTTFLITWQGEQALEEYESAQAIKEQNECS